MQLWCIAVYLIFKNSGVSILNPNKIKGMEHSLTFNTANKFYNQYKSSRLFVENLELSYLSQMIAITFLMFTSAATGFAAAAAFIRGIVGKTKTVGNFFVDLIRVTTRILLPLSIVIAVILVWQGVPQTLSPNTTVTTIEGNFTGYTSRTCCSLESIKHIGTNGGGFFGANSAHPFENPTPLTNLIEILSYDVITRCISLCFWILCLKIKNKAWTIFAAMAILFLISTSSMLFC